jgi:Na+-transporting NADH:ubiquinone oxidoreductase subunit A
LKTKKILVSFLLLLLEELYKDISRGDKRKFLSIEIEITENEEAESFHYENTSKGLTNLLINSGLWNAFRTRPFNRTPKVEFST